MGPATSSAVTFLQENFWTYKYKSYLAVFRYMTMFLLKIYSSYVYMCLRDPVTLKKEKVLEKKKMFLTYEILKRLHEVITY